MQKNFDNWNENKKARHTADLFVLTEGESNPKSELTRPLPETVWTRPSCPQNYYIKIKQTEKPSFESLSWADDSGRRGLVNSPTIIRISIPLSTASVDSVVMPLSKEHRVFHTFEDALQKVLFP